ncbi:synapsin-2-like [Scomber scombrus]|uniref:Synapsin-2-like n=1 Tax=Scomber scombrus TaxID=13677 RepID=A0AAV1ND69_SCOSC
MVSPEPLPLRQCNSNSSVQQGQSKAQQEIAAQPLRENPRHRVQTSVDHEQQQSLLEDRATEEKPQAHPQLNKSQTLFSAFGLKDSSIFRTASEDTESTETIRNLRKSFANLFSE